MFNAVLSYSHINPLDLSLAYTGILVRRNLQEQLSSEYDVSERDTSHSVLRDNDMNPSEERNKKEGGKNT